VVFGELLMKIMILATAALVATTLGAQADLEPVRVSKFPGAIGAIVTATIELEAEGKGISGPASSAPARPAFAPVKGMFTPRLEAPDPDGPLW
jgi:hypothetical protein